MSTSIVYSSYGITKEEDTLVHDSTLDSEDKLSNYKEAVAGPEAANGRRSLKARFNLCTITKFGIWLIIHQVARQLGVNGSSKEDLHG